MEYRLLYTNTNRQGRFEATKVTGVIRVAVADPIPSRSPRFLSKRLSGSGSPIRISKLDANECSIPAAYFALYPNFFELVDGILLIIALELEISAIAVGQCMGFNPKESSVYSYSRIETQAPHTSPSQPPPFALAPHSTNCWQLRGLPQCFIGEMDFPVPVGAEVKALEP